MLAVQWVAALHLDVPQKLQLLAAQLLDVQHLAALHLAVPPLTAPGVTALLLAENTSTATVNRRTLYVTKVKPQKKNS